MTPPALGEVLPLHFEEASNVTKFLPSLTAIIFYRGEPDTAARHLRGRLDPLVQVWHVLGYEGHAIPHLFFALLYKFRCRMAPYRRSPLTVRLFEALGVAGRASRPVPPWGSTPIC